MSIERELLKNWTETTYQEPEVQLAAGPARLELTGMAVPDTETPAFTMPGMGKRSQKSEVGQNLPVLAADAAAGAGKGLVSGIAGFAGDIESLYQGVKGLITRGGDEGALDAFLKGMAQKTIAPTSEDVSKWLDANVGPVVPANSGMSPEMQKAREGAAGAGEFAGQLAADPTVAIKGAKAVASIAKSLTTKGAKLTPEIEVLSAGDITKPAFKKWFGESKVTDDAGTPIVVYHARSGDFEEFKTTGKEIKTKNTGSFFSSSPEVASTYATGKNENIVPAYISLKNPLIVDANGDTWSHLNKASVNLGEGKGTLKVGDLSIKSKLTEFDRNVSTDDVSRWARSNGYDGVIFNNVLDFGPSGKYMDDKAFEPSNVYVAFDPNQIKSVFNKGTWNPEDPRILHGAGGVAIGSGASTMDKSQQEPK